MLRILFLLLFTTSVFAEDFTQGWIPNIEDAKRISAQSEDNRIVIRALENIYKGDENAFNWKPLYNQLKQLGKLTQEELDSGRLSSLNQRSEGSCVGYATAIMLDLTLANQASKPELRLAMRYRVNADACYGLSRQNAGRLGGWQGSSGSWAMKALQDIGMLYRKQYNGFDTRQHSPSIAAQYRSKGLPRDLIAQIIHQCEYVQIKTISEAKAALQSGLAINICAQASYPSTRDSDGFLRRNGRAWSHSMCVSSYRSKEKTGREGYLVHNSWGDEWVRGPIFPEDQPRGSFWISAEDLQYHLSQGDSWTVLKAESFEAENLTLKDILDFEGVLNN